MEAFQQHVTVEAASGFDGVLDVFNGLQIHRHTLPLFTVQRLDHHPVVLVEKRQVVIGIAGQLLRRQVQARVLEHFVGQAFVLAQAHADGAGQIAEGLATTHPAPAMTEGEHPGIGVIDLHINAASMGFFDDDPRIGIERRLGARAEEQRLVDPVLALDGERREVAKTELGVEVLRLPIVVQHRQVEVTQATTHEVFDQVPYQHFADPRSRAMRIDRQAPEAAAVFRIIEGLVMIEAHDAANHRAAVLVFGQPVHRPARAPWRQQRGIDRQHAPRLVQLIDRVPVRFTLGTADAKAAKYPGGLTVIAEPQAQGVGGIEK